MRELLSERARDGRSDVRVRGELVPGSQAWGNEGERNFLVESDGLKLPVRYTGRSLPDTFGESEGVDHSLTAEGKLGSDGRFQAIALEGRPGTPPSVSLVELTREGSRHAKIAVRVAGGLVRGSLRRGSDCEFLFVLESEGLELPVRYSGCVVPDTFRDMKNVEATVEGKLGPDRRFEATWLMAKNWGPFEMRAIQKRHE